MDIDIIIPIYNAFDFVKKCIETVIEHTDLTQHTLLLVNDKSTDERILPLLNSFIKENQSLNIILIDNKDNQGFVRTVNIGMQYSHHDVVLLNSDTEVTRNWLSKIQNCAYSKPAVASGMRFTLFMRFSRQPFIILLRHRFCEIISLNIITAKSL